MMFESTIFITCIKKNHSGYNWGKINVLVVDLGGGEGYPPVLPSIELQNEQQRQKASGQSRDFEIIFPVHHFSWIEILT